MDGLKLYIYSIYYIFHSKHKMQIQLYISFICNINTINTQYV